MSTPPIDDSHLLLHVRCAIRGPKAIAVTWGDGRKSVICLWSEVGLHSLNFEGVHVADHGTAITWSDRNVSVAAARLAEMVNSQDKDPLPPAVFSTWKAGLGLDTEAAAKHLAVNVTDIKQYESGISPIPNVIGLLCREWLDGEEAAYEKECIWLDYIELREKIDRAYEASKAIGISKNKALSNAAHILGWIDGKRHSERSIHFLPWLYKRLTTEGFDGPPLKREAAIEKIRITYGLASWESARKYLVRKIGDWKKMHPDDTTFEDVILPFPTVTKKQS